MSEEERPGEGTRSGPTPRPGVFFDRRPEGREDPLGTSTKLDRLVRGVSRLDRERGPSSAAMEPDEPGPQIEALDRLIDLSRQLPSGLDRQTLLEAILDAVMSLEIADRALLVLREGDSLRVVCERDRSGRSLASEKSRISNTLVLDCLKANRVRHYNNLSEIPELRRITSIAELSLKSAICIPLQERGEPFGVLYLDSAHLSFLPSNPHAKLLEAFAAHAAVCLGYARSVEEGEEKQALLARQNEDLRVEVEGGWRLENLLGESKVWQQMLEQVRLAKDVDNPVLLVGESGTGKEEVARTLHYRGHRAKHPFVAFNCAAVPEGLIEAELFGAQRGAYTNAFQDRIGLLQRADGGTLFLDEIGDMPLAVQPTLLRFLDSGTFSRVGEGGVERRVDVRVISATNRHLEDLMKEGRFREDLFFRIKGVQIRLPPLRERREDLPLLISHFLERARQQLTPKTFGSLTDGALRLLISHPWRGNVRDLIQVIEGACALLPEGRDLDAQHLAPFLSLEAANATAERTQLKTLKEAKRRTERECLVSALELRAWDIKAVAKDLGITRQHVHNLIRSHQLERLRPGGVRSSERAGGATRTRAHL